MFALTSTWPYYSIPVWHTRLAFLPTTLLWYLEKQAACFNGNWIWSARIFFHQKSSAGLFPVCIPCVSLRDAGPPPGHTFLKHRLPGIMSAALKSAALFAGVGPKLEWGESWRRGSMKCQRPQFCCPIHSHTRTWAHSGSVQNNERSSFLKTCWKEHLWACNIKSCMEVFHFIKMLMDFGCKCKDNHKKVGATVLLPFAPIGS